jgi:hypothetical protein
MRNKAATFYFIGAAILPPLTALSGEWLLAAQFFIALVLAGIICRVGRSPSSVRKPPQPRS